MPATLHSLLIVEDDDSHFALVARFLKKSKDPVFEITRAVTVEEGEKIFNSQTFSAVLLDLNLPDSDASTTIESIGHKFDEAPVLVLTSMEEHALVHEAATKGAQEFLDKFTLDQKSLVRSILYAIERKKNLNLLATQNAELKHFSHTIAHEIKNPASAMKMALEILSESLQGNPAFTEDLSHLIDQGIASGAVLSATIDEMLRFAEADGAVFEKSEIELKPLLKFVVNQTVLSTGAPRDTITIRRTANTVYGNEVLLRQLIANLISNAWRYRSSGTKPQILIEAIEEQEWTIIKVIDNGIGIRSANLQKIFQLFYREKEDPQVKGSGIGLGFCKTVVEKHGGEISVESEVGKGSSFTVKLPRSSS